MRSKQRPEAELLAQGLGFSERRGSGRPPRPSSRLNAKVPAMTRLSWNCGAATARRRQAISPQVAGSRPSTARGRAMAGADPP